MIAVRRSDERGHAQRGWLDSRFTFSFAEYHDPKFMGFRSLRVINEDHIAPGQGFGTHPHRDMEIITYVVRGALEHRDSLGTGSVIGPGDAQRMSAGTGILHSEFNASQTEPVHLLQIWILPEREGIEPGYEQKQFPVSDRQGRWRVLASPDGQDGSVTIHQDASLLTTLLEAGETLRYDIAPGRYVWLQLIRGSLTVNGQELNPGDGAAISSETALELRAQSPVELLLFDLA